jgi:radical SAM superfamily enzyme YgiQ (UPF0313 family)
MSFTILQSTRSFQVKDIVLIDLRYPYGKSKAYMNGSLCATAASLIAIGNKVVMLDFNIDDSDDPKVLDQIQQADLVGISVIGSPYIPSAIDFVRRFASKTILIGGQAIAKLTREQFRQLFGNTNAVQITSNADLAQTLDCSPGDIPDPFSSPMTPVWQSMGKDRLEYYLRREFALVLSQGCNRKCDFCGAEKKQRERFVELDIFKSDMLFLASTAKGMGLAKIEAYASSLDFFQNPEEVAKYLEALAQTRKQTGVDFKVRCLSCTDSFVSAYRKIDHLENLLNRAGLWCIGFGVDGTDEKVWKSQHKTHNDLHDVNLCLDICEAVGVRSEVLMVMGFAKDTAHSLWKNLRYSIRYVRRWKNVVIRPYLAKPFIPGNKEWRTDPRVSQVIENPDLFYNLDFCALGSRLTHPRRIHRWLCNLSYLTMIVLLTPGGHCTTSPLLPQGNKGRLTKLVNRLMPFDR